MFQASCDLADEFGLIVNTLSNLFVETFDMVISGHFLVNKRISITTTNIVKHNWYKGSFNLLMMQFYRPYVTGSFLLGISLL